MYFSLHQSAAAPDAVNRRRHSFKPSLRLFAIRFGLMFTLLMFAFSAGAIVQANAGPAAKSTGTGTVQSAASNAPAAQTAITVEQGDTLWTIAQANLPKGTDVRSYMEQIKRLNRLTGTTLKVGQQLLLP